MIAQPALIVYDIFVNSCDITDERMAVKYESCGDYYFVVDDETDSEPIAICGQRDLKCIYKYCEVFKKPIRILLLIWQYF